MVDYNTQVKATLDDILPTYYELYDGEMELPCITYKEEYNNTQYLGDTMEYAQVSFNIKVYAYSKAEIETYSNSINTAMRTLGFRRTQTNEMSIGNQIFKIMSFKALSWENFNN